MLTIFDPVNLWLGASSPFVPSQTNKRPVAIDDMLSVDQDSGPVTVAVLANDFDPEEQPLTLVSASAQLGTAVAEADNTVTYTPPPGLTGFDTVLYEIADDLDQRQVGQINVTIVSPVLSIDMQGDNTMVVNAATGQIDITITDPAVFAGTYQSDVEDVLTGPVPLAPPAIAGTAAEGGVLTAVPGLWVHDAGVAAPVTSWQWARGGADIGGATAATYTIQSGDLAQGLSLRETQTDTHGQRVATSATLSGGGGGFAPHDDPLLIGWWDAADVATLTETGGVVSAWADKAGGDALAHGVAGQQPVTGSRTLNGLNVLDFDGNQLLAVTRSLPASGDVAFHMAVILDATDNVFDALISVDASNDFQLDAADGSAFAGRLNVAGIGSSVDLTGGPYSGAVLVSLVFDQTGSGTAEVFVSDVSRGSTAYTAPLDPTQVLRVMANRAGSLMQAGAFGELVVTGDVGNRATYHSYLATKWGLA